MSDKDDVKILIRHTSGSKANSVQEFSVTGRKELRFGRDPSCDVAYDPQRDDVVSRAHAVIRPDPDAKSGFSVEDLGSRNGTFLNKAKIEGKTEILPDDVLTLGTNGPSFIFDLSPRPENLVARTKVIDLVPVAATRVLGATETGIPTTTTFDLKAPAGSTQNLGATPGKETIGRNTMLHEIGKVRDEAEQERKAAGQKWFAALAAVLVLALAGGGLLLLRQNKERKVEQAALEQARLDALHAQQESATQQQEAVEGIRRQMGMSSLDIVRQYGLATAQVEVRWRLYDQETGREIFQKTIKHENGNRYRLFVRFSDGTTVLPILTLNDENRSNYFIGGDIAGTAFGVSEQGFLLTNRHLAAAWKTAYYAEDGAQDVLLIDCYGKTKKQKCSNSIVKLSDTIFDNLRKWVPEAGWYLFDAKDYAFVGGNTPDNTNTKQHSFYGKNETVKVTFANSRIGMGANLVRVSDENDVALIKVDTPSKINVVKIAEHSDPQAGEKVTVLGYPDIAAKTFAVTEKFVDAQLKTTDSFVPEPYVTEGIIAIVSNQILAKDGVTMYGPQGNMLQLTINSTGPGNSGGPVFNSVGDVIGIFTMAYKSGFGSSSGAVPIKYGVELMH
ncbi:trypsin-like peptidase domain-containing protein [Rhodoblastus sp.]|uniref:trypsin-like peptidase domain-containing protein n=1 Tax=Rhodoblastus sp. TaxID=1962975 RepID=UPI003F9621AC